MLESEPASRRIYFQLDVTIFLNDKVDRRVLCKNKALFQILFLHWCSLSGVALT